MFCLLYKALLETHQGHLGYYLPEELGYDKATHGGIVWTVVF